MSVGRRRRRWGCGTSYGWVRTREREREKEQRSEIYVGRTEYRKRTEHAVNVRSLVLSSKAKRRDSVKQLTRNEWERRCWPARSCRWRRSSSDSFDHWTHLYTREQSSVEWHERRFVDRTSVVYSQEGETLKFVRLSDTSHQAWVLLGIDRVAFRPMVMFE